MNLVTQLPEVGAAPKNTVSIFIRRMSGKSSSPNGPPDFLIYRSNNSVAQEIVVSM